MTNTQNPFPLEMGSPQGVAYVQHHRTASLWYAWGRQDAAPGSGVDAMDFSLWYAIQAAEMYRGERSGLRSVQDAWAAYANGERS